MIDFNDYVGIPWKCGKASTSGADCWGLVCMIYIDLFGIRLAHFEIDTINSAQKTTDQIETVRDNATEWERAEVPMRGDVVMMIGRSTLRPEHVGIYTDHGNVLHSLTRETGQSEIHQIKLLKKLFKRLEFYRYVG